MKEPLPCICCGKQLGNAMAPENVREWGNQPYNGTVFMTNGQFGSTVFEEFYGKRLEITVCDVCLLDAAKEQRVMTYMARERMEFSGHEFWVPEPETDAYAREVDQRRTG